MWSLVGFQSYLEHQLWNTSATNAENLVEIGCVIAEIQPAKVKSQAWHLFKPVRYFGTIQQRIPILASEDAFSHHHFTSSHGARKRLVFKTLINYQEHVISVDVTIGVHFCDHFTPHHTWSSLNWQTTIFMYRATKNLFMLFSYFVL